MAKRSYLPFGETWGISATELPTDYTFTGQRESFETGLVYYIARWYDSEIGHFIQADVVIPDAWNTQAWNKYSYVYYNPIISSDPTGHLTEKQIKKYTGHDIDYFSPEMRDMLLALRFGDSLSGYDGSSYFNYGGVGLDESGHLVFGSFSMDDLIANHGELYLTRTVGDSSWVSWSSWGISDNEGPDNMETILNEERTVGHEWDVASLVVDTVVGFVCPPFRLSKAAGAIVGLAVGLGQIYIEFPGFASGDIVITYASSNSPGEMWYQTTIIRNDQIISSNETFIINEPISEFPYQN